MVRNLITAVVLSTAAVLTSTSAWAGTGFLQNCLAQDEYNEVQKTIETCSDEGKIGQLSSKDASRVYTKIGTAFHWARRPEFSIKYFDKAIARDASNDEAINQRAWSYWGAGDYASANSGFIEAISINPRQHKAFMGIASILSSTGRHSEALAAYRQALDIKPDYVLAKSNLAVFLMNEKRDFSQALKLLDEILALPTETLDRQQYLRSPEELKINFTLRGVALKRKTESLYELKQYDEALKVIEKLEKEWPTDLFVNLAKSNVMLQLEQYSEAIKYADLAVDNGRYAIGAASNKLIALKELGEFAKLIEVASQTLDRPSSIYDQGTAYSMRSLAYRKQGKFAEAKADIIKAMYTDSFHYGDVIRKLIQFKYYDGSETDMMNSRMEVAIEACMVDPNC
jgi:tetratricopeptide (TPR) repeat protein